MCKKWTVQLYDYIERLFENNNRNLNYLIMNNLRPTFTGVLGIDQLDITTEQVPIVFGKPSLWVCDTLPKKLYYRSIKYGKVIVESAIVEKILYAYIDPLIKKAYKRYGPYTTVYIDSRYDTDTASDACRTASEQMNLDFDIECLLEYGSLDDFRKEAYEFVYDILNSNGSIRVEEFL